MFGVTRQGNRVGEAIVVKNPEKLQNIYFFSRFQSILPWDVVCRSVSFSSHVCRYVGTFISVNVQVIMHS